MTGRVDALGRALLPIPIRASAGTPGTVLEVWIDTGFNGHLVAPRSLLTSLGLPAGPSGLAILADGSKVNIDTYSVQIEWFGAWWTIQVVASDGQLPLLGVGLLLGHELRIDYTGMTLTLT